MGSVRETILNILAGLSVNNEVKVEGMVKWKVIDEYLCIRSISTNIYYVLEDRIRLFIPKTCFLEGKRGYARFKKGGLILNLSVTNAG